MRKRRHDRLRPVLAGLLWLAGSACRSVEPDDEKDERPVVLSVFAASSLTEAFEDLERGFERSHPTIDVQLAFAGSQVLRLQIEQGAAADVYASANEAHMRALHDARLVGASQTFASNELVVITPRQNPAGIESLADLPRASRIVVGTENVPVGAYTREVLTRAAEALGPEFSETVESNTVSRESNVRHVRAKVELGEADAAVVYRTDAIASDRLTVVPIAADFNVRARYPIAITSASQHPNEAAAFVGYVMSPDGQRALASRGFSTEVE